MDADAPDESSEGSGNPDQDWDGGDNDDEDDASKGVSQVGGSTKPGSAKFFGRHKVYMQCLTQIIGLTTTQDVDVLESQGITLKLLTDSNITSLFDDKALKGVPLSNQEDAVRCPLQQGHTAHSMLAQIYLTKPRQQW